MWRSLDRRWEIWLVAGLIIVRGTAIPMEQVLIPPGTVEEVRYAWTLPDRTILLSDGSNLVRLNRQGKVLREVALRDPSLGPYRMTMVMGGFLTEDSLWVADVTPKLVRWSLDLRPLQAFTVPKVYYIGSILRRGEDLWVGGLAPQEFYLTPGWHVFRYSWPDLKLRDYGSGTPPEMIEHRMRIGMGGWPLLTVDDAGIVYWVAHTFPTLVRYDPATKKNVLRPLPFWQSIWVEPRRGEEAPPVYALHVEYLPPGLVGVQIRDARSPGVRYWLEVVSGKDGQTFVRELPGRWVGRDPAGRWIFWVPKDGKYYIIIKEYEYGSRK